MKNGKAVQAGTSHYLGTKFAEAFNIKYLTKANQHEYVHTTSWGTSTRLIGSVIMVHGDEQGLVLPPRIAPTQVVLIPVGPWKKNPQIMEHLDEIFAALKAKGIRVCLDDSDQSPGFKFNEWELKGVPVRVELGPRDLENKQALLKARDEEEKRTVDLATIITAIEEELTTMQTRLLEKLVNSVKQTLIRRLTHFHNYNSILTQPKTMAQSQAGYLLDGVERMRARKK